MGRKTISNQIHSALADKIAFGESKHLDKIERETSFGKSTYKIECLHRNLSGRRCQFAPILSQALPNKKPTLTAPRQREQGGERDKLFFTSGPAEYSQLYQ